MYGNCLNRDYADFSDNLHAPGAATQTRFPTPTSSIPLTTHYSLLTRQPPCALRPATCQNPVTTFSPYYPEIYR